LVRTTHATSLQPDQQTATSCQPKRQGQAVQRWYIFRPEVEHTGASTEAACSGDHTERAAHKCGGPLLRVNVVFCPLHPIQTAQRRIKLIGVGESTSFVRVYTVRIGWTTRKVLAESGILKRERRLTQALLPYRALYLAHSPSRHHRSNVSKRLK
jgi:hypothetical protein